MRVCVFVHECASVSLRVRACVYECVHACASVCICVNVYARGPEVDVKHLPLLLPTLYLETSPLPEHGAAGSARLPGRPSCGPPPLPSFRRVLERSVAFTL